ncbi:prolyl oligopeptidase family serine peptidase [Paraglaciecola sp.]|uniref:extracellular catalytic domain type 2 short-chain-length polyhydroxyalkanoate depolymerase n=1 Tax=Paraglaciecola sp. TaxID=1920173 RepID=UPI003267C77F
MKKTTLLILGSLTSVITNLDATPLTLDTQKIAVSGLSSGGYMANQFHIAHSKWVDKVGIMAAGPYYCANNSIKEALEKCVNKSTENTDKDLHRQANIYAKNGDIDPLENIANSKVWLLRGNKDTTIAPAVSKALFTQYKNWLNEDQLKFVTDQPFGHHFPTLANGTKCHVSEAPFIGNCNYDGAGEMLNYLYDSLAPRVTKTTGKLQQFDQHNLGGDSAQSLAKNGFAYIPSTCLQGEMCKVHIHFHGCQQNEETIGTQYVTQNGINNWADNNHLIVIYPQTKNSMFMPLNPQGCWDWWGYTDKKYATKKGQQVKAIKNMVNSFAAKIKLGE